MPSLTPLPCTSGAAVSQECEQKLLQQDVADPVNGEKLLDHAQRQYAAASGTDFPGSGVSLQVEKSRLVIQAWCAGHQINRMRRGKKIIKSKPGICATLG